MARESNKANRMIASWARESNKAKRMDTSPASMQEQQSKKDGHL